MNDVPGRLRRQGASVLVRLLAQVRARIGADALVFPAACVLTMLLLIRPVHAQDLREQQEPTAGGLTVTRQGGQLPFVGGHAWLVRAEQVSNPNLPTFDRTLILHLPPRTGGPQELRGVIRFAGGFENRTDRIAWWGNRVYFVLDREPSGEPAGGQRPTMVRRVLGLTAIRGAGSSYWYPPGRPEVLSSLDGSGELIGLVGTRVGPAALVRLAAGGRAGTSETSLVLWVLSDGRWIQAALPWEMGLGERGVGGSGLMPRLVPWRDGVALAYMDGTEGKTPSALRLWIGRLAPGRSSQATLGSEPTTVHPMLAWQGAERSLPAGLNLERAQSGGKSGPDVYFVEGGSLAEDALLAVDRPAGSAMDTVRLYELRASAPVLLGESTGIPPSAEVLPMASPAEGGAAGTLAFVWTVRPTGQTPGNRPTAASDDPARDAERGRDRYEIREFSAITGRELYRGPARDSGLLNRGQYQTLVVVLLLVMVAVLVFVLRGDPQIVPSVPKGKAFAEPVRRALAGLLDYAPAAVAVAMATGRGPLALLYPQGTVSGTEFDLLSLGMALGACAAHCTIGEWLFGRSIGKFLLGCRVVNVSSAGDAAGTERPRLWQALVRNLVRWTVPILAVFMIFDPARRHPGDLAARTIVICDEPDPDE